MIVFQKESEQLLKDTIQMNGNAVAKEIEKIHREYTSVIQYNNENSLSSVLSIAYLSSMQYYFKPIREFPAVVDLQTLCLFQSRSFRIITRRLLWN